MTYFDAIYVINLPSRTDRRAQMQAQLRKVGIDPDASPVRFFDAIRPDDAAGFPTIGARGCFLSHLGVLRDARDAGHQRILVLEDDLDFGAGFVRRFEALAPALEQLQWDLWHLGALSVTPMPAGAGELLVLPPHSVVLGTHMLAFHARVIAPLIAYLEAMAARPEGDPAGGPMHVDGAYFWFRRAHPQVRTVLAAPVLGHQRPSRTDVHTLRWFDRLPGLDKAVALLRGARERLALRR